MRKITLLTLMVCFSSFVSAQCLTATGQWPTATYTPLTCDGFTVNTATGGGYANEYSKINVVAGETYQFSSSNPTDVITISDEAGTNVLAYGENAYVLWVSDVSGVVRFYTHKDNTCAGEGFTTRFRNVICGTPPSCMPASGVDVAAVGLDSASLGWNASNTNPANGYDYILTQDSTAPDASSTPDATLPAGTLTVDFTALSELTQYYFWVRANCGGGDVSTWVGTDFTTLGPPPVNDDATGAITLTLDIGTACGPNKITGISNANTTPSAEVDPTCMDQYDPSFGNGDMWYAIQAPASSFTINVSDITGQIITVSSALYSGTPGNLTETGTCGNAGTKTYSNLVIGDTYYLRVWDYANDGIGTFSLCGWYIDCENPTATYTPVFDCASAQFNVEVEVTDMGTATSLTISDDQGNASQTANGTGVYSFGPYAEGTSVVITVANDQSDFCTITSGTLQSACPPVNDDPAGAIELTLDLGAACGPNKITGISNAATTGSDAEVDPSCIDQYNPSNGNGDLWYYFVAPAPTLSLNISDITGGIFTVSSVLYSGTPGNFTEVGACGNAATKNYTGLTVGDTYYFRVWDYANDGIGTFSICGWYLDCENPTATYTVVSDCANGDQFLVDVNVTGMGSATSLTISDNQGSTSQTAGATGTYTFGPFANGTSVIFTLQNDQSAACMITSTAQTQGACPQDCAAAEVIANCGDAVTASFSGAGAWNITTCGFQTNGAEKLYSFTPTVTGLHKLTITASTGGYVDYFYKEASGTCDATGWSCIGDATLPETNNIGTLTAGTQYLILLDSENVNPKDVTFSIVCPTLGVEDSAFESLSVYPNPVKNILNLSGTRNISGVSVFNMLGQQMMAKVVNSNESQIDMTHLASGTYFVKVSAENQVKTIKVVKQ
ncbi:hypothetical protein HYN48_14300 [Flavobacterium magnum]|uniref:Fibronectin type-III domain-containing protein n=1 Tax=Flavobacterium magnum TaxID=2162713 RepID=A0A2S0RIR8_9FLAO|nr:T9SS type A sorting domain-containing protein [Flavobacterium magnum]AWA31170.1 hypothetical protein HYN48_14300 [Flavobacterium magnum]